MVGTIIAVASGKGGVGKTAVTLNLGVALHREGAEVTIVDLDLGMPNLAAALGFEPDRGIQDVLAGSASLEEVTLDAREGQLLLVPGVRALDRYAGASPGQLGSIIPRLREGRDVVLLDTAAGLAAETVRPIEHADEVILVSTPENPALENTRKTRQLARLADTPVRGAIINRAADRQAAKDAVAALDTDLLGYVPEDSGVTESMVAGRPLAIHAPKGPATIAFQRIAERLLSEPEPIERSRPTDTLNPEN